MKPRSAIFAVLAAAAISACGGGGSSNPYMTTTGGGGSTGGGGTPPPPSNSATVSIADYSFTPATVTIKAGGSVTWMNGGSVAHTTTADAGAWDSGQLSGTGTGGAYGGGGTGGSYTKMFPTAGNFTYHCANHTYMTGTVAVTP